VTSSVPNAEVGIPYSQVITTFGGSGGNTFSVASFPQGLQFNSATGVISGQVAAPFFAAGQDISVTDSDNSKAGPRNYNITGNAALKLSTSPLADATVNLPYVQSIQTTGGDGCVLFTAKDLPGWLSLNPLTGVLTGTPSSAGTASFTVTATDDLGSTDTQSLSDNAKAPSPLGSPQPTSASMSLSSSDAVPGQPVGVTVLVAAASGIPTGMVTITGLAAGTLVLPLVNGMATFETVLSLGRYNLRASYDGGPGFEPSISAPKTLAEHAVAVEPASDPGGQSVLALGTTTGKEVISLRRHGKLVTIRMAQTRGGRFQAVRTIPAAYLTKIVVYGDATRDWVVLQGGPKLPVAYIPNGTGAPAGTPL
jgi:hypothetical protein